MGESNAPSLSYQVGSQVALTEPSANEKNVQDALHRLNRLHTNFEARKYAISLDDRGLLIEQMLNWCRETGYQVRLVWPLFLNERC